MVAIILLALKTIKSFLDRFYFEDYVPHVRHVVYPVLMLAAGFKCLNVYQWEVFGLIMIISGSLLMLVIIVGIGWRGPIEYWRQIEQNIKIMLKINDPQVWVALGFKEIPEIVTTKEYIEAPTANSLPTIRYTRAPANDVIVLNTIANKVLLSGKADFTEELYGRIVKGKYKGGWKAFVNDFKNKGYVTKANKHPKSKHVLTRKGLNHVYNFADEAIKLQITKEGKSAT